MTNRKNHIAYLLNQWTDLKRLKVSIAPLVVFRIWFGLMMVYSVIRFAWNGWIDQLYLQPTFFFSYYGFEWVQPLSAPLLYGCFILMGLTALGIMLGAYYRISTVIFFVAFTYVELLDKTNYLNHYYFVSLVAFLLIWIPAHGHFSIDAWRKRSILKEVSIGYLWLLRAQVGIVYSFAGLAKINSEWLLRAQPLQMWLGSLVSKPLIGGLFRYKITAYLFSWFGMIYDLTIPLWLSMQTTRWYAYTSVILFHGITWYLFPIGIFPLVMIGSALIFFPVSFHERILVKLESLFRVSYYSFSNSVDTLYGYKKVIFSLFITIQLALPFRYLLYPGDLFWTEQGYRFSWRVMLMEKAGSANFRVVNPQTGKALWVSPYEYLTPQQEKMMATQPDMILQFAHYLRDVYEEQFGSRPQIYADAFVTINGRRSRRFINDTVDLAAEPKGLHHKTWILEP